MKIYRLCALLLTLFPFNHSFDIFTKKEQTKLMYFPFIDHQKEHIDLIQQETGKEIVLQISNMLPKFDTVGHDILRANHDFIDNVLHNELLSHEAKKALILGSIKLAQHGDDMGSFILQQYYNLVEACL